MDTNDRLGIPDVRRAALLSQIRRIDGLKDEIAGLDREIRAWRRASEVSQRLAAIPGVGVLTATALAATAADPAQFRSARQFAT
ncbi:MAG: transposase [Pikeienuella sp.]